MHKGEDEVYAAFVGIDWADKKHDIFDEDLRNRSDLHFSIDPPKRQIVDQAAERRDVASLGRVNDDGENVISVLLDMLRQLERERCVPAFVFAKLNAVDKDSRGRHHSCEIDEDPVIRQSGGKTEMTSIYRNECIFLLVEPACRQHLVRMRDRHLFVDPIVVHNPRCARENGLGI